MKRVLFVAFLLSVAVSFATAQIPGFSIGPKVGYNSNRLVTNLDSVTSTPEGAFQIGAFMRFGQKVYFQPEVNYIVKGGIINDVLDGEDRSQEIELKSITIPLLLGVRPVSEGSFNIRLMAGPTLSYISEKHVKPLELLSSWPIHSTDDIDKMLWSFQVGGGIDFWILTFDARYEVGISNIYTGDENLKVRNNLFNVSVGVKFL
ncbi:MAG TPA: porin family protein [Bacteroidales bacterium]|nr:porin family protein [Bacteroidales bacterium]HPT01353.1 porin family protein [Bacteroidales bacterium]